MRGIVKGNTIVLEDRLPPDIRDGESVEITIVSKKKKTYLFPIYPLSIKKEFLSREKIYEESKNFLRCQCPGLCALKIRFFREITARYSISTIVILDVPG